MHDEPERIYTPLQWATKIGINDIAAGRFRSFGTPEALVQHLQDLATDCSAQNHLTERVCKNPIRTTVYAI